MLWLHLRQALHIIQCFSCLDANAALLVPHVGIFAHNMYFESLSAAAGFFSSLSLCQTLLCISFLTSLATETTERWESFILHVTLCKDRKYIVGLI